MLILFVCKTTFVLLFAFYLVALSGKGNIDVTTVVGYRTLPEKENYPLPALSDKISFFHQRFYHIPCFGPFMENVILEIHFWSCYIHMWLALPTCRAKMIR